MRQAAAPRILFHSIGGLFGRLATATFSTLTILLMAVLLEPRDYGIYLLFTRTISLITLLGDLGHGQSAMAHFSLFACLDRKLHGRFTRIIFVSSAFTCLVTAIVLVGAGGIIVPELSPTILWLLVATIPANLYANFWYGMMVGSGLIWPLNIVRAITGALFLVSTLVFVLLFEGGLTAALFTWCGVTLVQMAAMLAVAHFYAVDNAAPQPPTRLLVHFALRSHPNAVFHFVWTTLPLFVLAAEHGPAAAGIFGLATQILDKLMLPAHALHEAIYQRMRILSREDAAAEATVYGATIFAVATAIALFFAPFVYWVLPPLLGESYAAIGAATATLLLGLPFMSALLLFDPYFVNAMQRPGFASWLGAVQVLIVAAVSVWIIPPLATAGAAVSLVLAQMIGFAVALFALKRLADLSWLSLLAVLATAIQGRRMQMRLFLDRSGSRS